ncbi:thioredoxin domain-containing protein [Streptomyces sp. NPDC002133]|uniref:thioredoxin domain-containing protein n=1 Tax=Streptomyces sp. NPDC002133 TaxID=3154409 RepID=UPI00331E8413
MTGCGQAGQVEVPGAAAYAGIEELPEKLSENGTTIIVGDPKAPMTVHLYEDPRCPVVEEFEAYGGASVLRELTELGRVKTEYTFASFRDDRMGGGGSKRAVNALRAALEAGKFAEYHDVLFQHQPEAEVDGYTTEYLLELAGKVDGLRSPAFDTAVKTMKYRAFVTQSEETYENADGPDPLGPGTPTAVINGRQVPETLYWVLFDRQEFTRLLVEIEHDPGQWQIGL